MILRSLHPYFVEEHRRLVFDIIDSYPEVAAS